MKTFFVSISVLFFSNLILPIPPRIDYVWDSVLIMTPRGTKSGVGSKNSGYAPCPSDCPRKSRFGGIEEFFSKRR